MLTSGFATVLCKGFLLKSLVSAVPTTEIEAWMLGRRIRPTELWWWKTGRQEFLEVPQTQTHGLPAHCHQVSASTGMSQTLQEALLNYQLKVGTGLVQSAV